MLRILNVDLKYTTLILGVYKAIAIGYRSGLCPRASSSSREEAERLGMDIHCVVEESLRRAIIEERKKRIAEALKELAAAGEDPRGRLG